MQANNIITMPLKGLKLSPGDILIIHFAEKPTDAQIHELKLQMTAETWGLGDVKFKILYGPFEVMSTKQPE